jgi:hypothetical protein
MLDIRDNNITLWIELLEIISFPLRIFQVLFAKNLQKTTP